MNFSQEEARIVLDAIEFHARGINASLEKLSPESEGRTSAVKRLEMLQLVKSRLALPAEPIATAAMSMVPSMNLKFSKSHLLLVDDSEAIRQHEIMILKRNGFNQIDQASDGSEAIAMIKRKVIPYDLILCDMNMPRTSGLEVLRMLRMEKGCAKIPFIMITSENNRDVLTDAIKAGVSDFVAKPVEEENLMKKITALL